jgi:hypothetical protein
LSIFIAYPVYLWYGYISHGGYFMSRTDNLLAARAYLNGEYLKEEVVPTLEGLCRTLGISHKLLKGDDGIEEVVEQIRLEQAKQLISGGLKGTHNANITRLILASKHGYIEKTQQVLDVSEQLHVYTPDKLPDDFDA